MRVVVDTNVFISAALKVQSTPNDAVRLATEQHLLLRSSTTEQELFITLGRPRLAPLVPPRLLDWLRGVLEAAEFVQIAERIVACRDAKDDKFLELAVNGYADLIVSGDANLLALDPFRNIPIITPAAFVQSTR